MDIREMNAKKVYDCLIAKAEKKGRERFEVDKVTKLAGEFRSYIYGLRYFYEMRNSPFLHRYQI